MHPQKDIFETTKPGSNPSPVWRQALNSVFGAARRLHQYRDARDVLLRQLIHEEERRLRHQAPCDEQW